MARRGLEEDRAKLARARLQYRLTHWGQGGKGEVRELDCADPRQGPFVQLGRLVSVVYETTKGTDRAPVQYEHDFSRRSLPDLVYSEGGLLICGGAYRVTVRGIVG